MSTKVRCYHSVANVEIELPTSRIKSKEELLDLIIECRKEKKAIRIYEVTQSGRLAEIFLTSKSQIIKPKGKGFGYYHSVPCWKSSPYRNERYWKTNFLPATYGLIDSTVLGEHCLFSSRLAAEKYSQYLKNHKEYNQAVKLWHKRCQEMFSGLY